VPFQLVTYAISHGIDIQYWDFKMPLEAVYHHLPGMKPTIGLSKRLFGDRIHFRCVLAEEIGHHFTTSGDRIPKEYFHYADRLSVGEDEYKAYEWSANFLVPNDKLWVCLNNGLNKIPSLSQFFEVEDELMRFKFCLLKSKVWTN
jgi:hypothetical protein